MKNSLFRPKWIVIGFNIGIGVAVALFAGWVLIAMVMSAIMMVGGSIVPMGFLLGFAALAVAVIFLLPAVTGRSLAAAVNWGRNKLRKPDDLDRP